MPRHNKAGNGLDLASLLQLIGQFTPSANQTMQNQQQQDTIKAEQGHWAQQDTQQANSLAAERQHWQGVLEAQQKQHDAELTQRDKESGNTLDLHKMMLDQQTKHETAMQTIQQQLADAQQMNTGREASRDAASAGLEATKLQQAQQQHEQLIAVETMKNLFANNQTDLALKVASKLDPNVADAMQQKADKAAAQEKAQGDTAIPYIKSGDIGKAKTVLTGLGWAPDKANQFIDNTMKNPQASAPTSTGPMGPPAPSPQNPMKPGTVSFNEWNTAHGIQNENPLDWWIKNMSFNPQ